MDGSGRTLDLVSGNRKGSVDLSGRGGDISGDSCGEEEGDGRAASCSGSGGGGGEGDDDDGGRGGLGVLRRRRRLELCPMLLQTINE